MPSKPPPPTPAPDFPLITRLVFEFAAADSSSGNAIRPISMPINNMGFDLPTGPGNPFSIPSGDFLVNAHWSGISNAVNTQHLWAQFNINGTIYSLGTAFLPAPGWPVSPGVSSIARITPFANSNGSFQWNSIGGTITGGAVTVTVDVFKLF